MISVNIIDFPDYLIPLYYDPLSENYPNIQNINSLIPLPPSNATTATITNGLLNLSNYKVALSHNYFGNFVFTLSCKGFVSNPILYSTPFPQIMVAIISQPQSNVNLFTGKVTYLNVGQFLGQFMVETYYVENGENVVAPFIPIYSELDRNSSDS